MNSLRAFLRPSRFSATISTAAATSSLTKNEQALPTCEVRERFRSERDPDKTLAMYRNLSSSNTQIPPLSSAFALCTTVERLAKARRFADVETLVESHKQDPRITQENFYSTLIRAYGNAGMAPHAFRMFNQMEEYGTARSVTSFNALLTACNMSRMFDQVPKLFDEIPKRCRSVSPDTISYNILIKSHCELNSVDTAALSILKEMEKRNIEISSVTHTTILHALYKKKKIVEAERLWREMMEKGCNPDVNTYNVRIMHARKGKPEDVLGLIDEMKKDGVKPDTTSYNHLLTCYSKNGMMEEALKVYRDLEENGCVPNAVTLDTCVSILCENRHFKKAYEVFEEGVKRNEFPSFEILKSLTLGLVKTSKVMQAEELITAVKKKLSASQLQALKGVLKENEVTTKKNRNEKKEKFEGKLFKGKF